MCGSSSVTRLRLPSFFTPRLHTRAELAQALTALVAVACAPLLAAVPARADGLTAVAVLTPTKVSPLRA